MDFYHGVVISIYFLAMMAIGFYSYRKSTSNVNEFLLGGRKLGAVVTALSVGATDMSGWLLMGLPGAVYAGGVSSSWIAIGLVVGAFLNYVLVSPRLRVYTEKVGNSITIPHYFENRFRDRSRLLRLISGLVILIFFTLYTSAGMVSGGRLFVSAFELPYLSGLLLTSSVVVFYTFVGGFLAVSLTDVVQGTIMVLALVLVPALVVFYSGGLGSSIDAIQSQDPQLLSLWTGATLAGVLSMLAWGLGYFGQPHILVRFMAIERPEQLRKARNIGISWMVFSMGGAILVGLFGIAFMVSNGLSITDPEMIFIYFAKELFHPLLGGILLSAILAAVMSTISSQLLVTSSAMTEDFYNGFFRRGASDREILIVSRGSVILVAVIAFLISRSPTATILDLVGHAWAGFGSAFGPLVLLSLLWKGTTRNGAVAGILVGGLTVLAWVYIPHPFQHWYAMIPGFLLSGLSILLVSRFGVQPAEDIKREFDEVRSEA